MGNRITRTVLFAASALLSISAFGAGAARFGTLRNADWVVTNAWQAVSNKTHDLIIDLGQEASLPPNWSNVSNAAMNSVQSSYSNEFGSATVEYSTDPGGEISLHPSGIYVEGQTYLRNIAILSDDTNGPMSSIILYGPYSITARKEMENYISTNNPAFVSAVLTAPLVGADPSDLSELAEYGSYGTVGAALLALIAGLAALKRRMASAEKAIEDIPYALVTPGAWEFSGVPDGVSNYSLVWDDGWFFEYYYEGESYGDSVPGSEDALELSFVLFDSTVTATRASLPGRLCDRAVNVVAVSSATTLTLPAANPGHARDLIVRLTISGSTVPTITFAAPTGETLTYETDSDEFPAPDEAGTWLYSFTETAAGTFAVALKAVSVVTQGGS